MKNKFFPTFEQDISATVKLCVLTVSFVVLTVWAVSAAQKAVTKIYKKMQADDLEFYRNAQANETLEKNRRKYASDQGAPFREAKAQRNQPSEQLNEK